MIAGPHHAHAARYPQESQSDREQALALTGQESERRFLKRRLAELAPSGGVGSG